jgi:HTH-type transcriptional regulator/antitoxin HigA
MGAIAIQTAIEHWQYLAPILSMPKTEAEYEALVAALDEVLDAGGADENHPLAQLADRMGELVEHYEDAHLPAIQATGIDALKFLMESHGLGQADLPEVGSQGVMSELLNGKRELNLRQIKALTARFQVVPQVFIP